MHGYSNQSYDSSYRASGGAGNPNGSDGTSLCSGHGTGGLLIIYGDSIINKGTFKSTGSSPEYHWSYSCSAGGGGSGGGSINVFYNTSLQKGSFNVSGGGGGSGKSGTSGTNASGYTSNSAKGGSGGSGTVSYGCIASGTYVAK